MRRLHQGAVTVAASIEGDTRVCTLHIASDKTGDLQKSAAETLAADFDASASYGLFGRNNRHNELAVFLHWSVKFRTQSVFENALLFAAFFAM